MNGNNFIYIYILSSVSPLLSFLFLIFPLVHFIIFVETKGENTFRQGGNILKAIFVPSRSEEKSLEIKKQISWKLLATWDRGGREKKSNQVNVLAVPSLPRYFLTGVVRVKIERR